jgi:hypothetical protein
MDQEISFTVCGPGGLVVLDMEVLRSWVKIRFVNEKNRSGYVIVLPEKEARQLIDALKAALLLIRQS